MMEKQVLLDVDRLVFEYRDRRVLHDVTFQIPAGSVTALVGPNGSGKTTLLRCIAALEDPLSGRITIDDVDVAKAPRHAHTKLGFLQDLFGVYDMLTVRQNLLHAAAALRVSAEQMPEALRSAVDAVGLQDYIDRPANELSRGLRQRLAVARTIIHNPRLLLLDEPASGLDPDARRDLSEMIKALQKRGATIIVSSHILTELQDYSTHMLAMRDGRVKPLVRIGAEAQQARRLAVTVANAPEHARAVLQSIATVSQIEPQGQQIFFDFIGAETDQTDLLRDLLNREVFVTELKIARENLEQLYFR
jgi:ABC-2 type transport system ATP-binding protein